MRVFDITVKDLKVFFRDRGALFMLFLLPFVFILVLSVAGQNIEFGSSAKTLLPLPVVNADPQGEATQSFLATLEDTGAVEIVPGEAAYVQDKLNQGNLEYALFVPADFSSNLVSGGQVTLQIKLHPNYNEANAMTVERAITRAAREFLMVSYLDQGLQQMAAMQAANPDAASAFSPERILRQVEIQKEQAAQRPLITTLETTPVKTNQEQDAVDMPEFGQVIVLGMAVLFVFLSAQNTAMSIFQEKRVGSFRRLLAAPVSKASLLGGKMLGNLILSMVQIAVIFFTGGLVIQLLGVQPLNFSAAPLGLFVTALATALCATSLGIFIAAIARTENQVGGLSTVLLFLAALLAGSFIPLFLFPEGLTNLVRVIPHYWANQAFIGLVFRNQTLVDVLPSIAALLVFALVFFAIGQWRFKFD
jgi:ABC-2 type transport system permease protein